MTTAPLTAISLFTGVGGFDLGLDRAGFRPVLLCEFDAWKHTVLAHHWPEVPIHDDVRTLDAPPSADIVHGGFPCQDVSIAGKRAGLAGGRTGLFWDALRVVDAVQPRAVLLENVPGLLSSNGGRDFGVVLGELADRGYGVAYRVLDAQHFGVPQRRRRVFVLALAGDDPRAAAERAAAVLALREGGGGDPAPSDEAGADAPARADGGAGNGRVVGALAGVGQNGGWRIGADEAAAGHLVAVHRVADTLTSGSHPNSNRPGRRREDDTIPVVANTLKGQRGKGGGGIGPEETLIPVAFHLTQDPISGNVAPAMGKGNSEGCATIGVLAYRKSARVNADPDSAETWVDDGLANTLNAFDVGDVRTTHAIVEPAASGVRRLTPVECERLMGWPDGWTAPEGVKAPDSRRYAACGDGVAAPVAEWIGHRLAAMLRQEGSTSDG